MPKPPTQTSIAKALGISRATVAEILGGTSAHRYNEATQQRVLEAAKALGYRPNRQARLLAGARSRVIGVIKSISTFQRNAELVLHAGEQVSRQGYEVMSSDIFWHGDGLERAVNVLLDLHVEGIILAHQAARFSANEQIRRLIDAGIPIVSLGGDPLEGIPYVSPDYFQAGQALAEHYLQCGYTRLSIVTQQKSFPATQSRFPITRAIQGFFAAATAAGCEDVQKEVLPKQPKEAPPEDSPQENAGHCVIRQIIERGTHENRGVAFFSDFHATGALQYCHQAGVQVPGQIGISGFDGGEGGALTWPPLTSVQHPTRELAHAAVDLLLKMIHNESEPTPEILIPCRIIPRGSTRPLLS